MYGEGREGEKVLALMMMMMMMKITCGVWMSYSMMMMMMMTGVEKSNDAYHRHSMVEYRL